MFSEQQVLPFAPLPPSPGHKPPFTETKKNLRSVPEKVVDGNGLCACQYRALHGSTSSTVVVGRDVSGLCAVSAPLAPGPARELGYYAA